MKFLLTLFSLLVVAIGTSYGSLATSYQMDVAQYGSRQVDGGWVLVDCRNGTFVLYKIDDGVVEAAICYLPMGLSFPESGVWSILPRACDRAGQKWIHYDNDRYGNPESAPGMVGSTPRPSGWGAITYCAFAMLNF